MSPSWELTYPLKSQILKMIFLFPKVGYVSFLEGIYHTDKYDQDFHIIDH